MIGWYVHHQGSGHLHRATTIAAHLEAEVTGLSSLERPAQWRGPWVRLPPDDDGTPPCDPTARGSLHWVPLRHGGVAARTAAISRWIEAHGPAALVVDVSVEVALLARLHGIPVVSTVLPGDRGDRAHRLGYAASSALLALWPAAASGMVRGLEQEDRRRLHAVGAVSRFPVADHRAAVDPRSVVALFGTGGDDLPEGWLERARASTPAWRWTALGGRDGQWTADPWSLVRSAAVVVTHAGQNAVAEVAAARRPAVVVPMSRPHDEQRTTARVLDEPCWPARVVRPDMDVDWERLLSATADLDGSAWSTWCDGEGSRRAAAVVAAVAGDAL